MSITPKKQKKKSRKGLSHAMILNDNAIDYVKRTCGSSEKRRLVEELHAPARRNFPRRGIVREYDDQADIVEMRSYSTASIEVHYILTVIDVLSKYA
ncbi:hypothetical protein ALC53_12814 [Atta colombica]|uniref:Uncharacterized protein n=1 Tax=Atta colombica TaxID=520822 RepID=A0A151HYT0_9HYME|nr:hypothetical protein ALC53_12814 [Atta colombica]